MDGFLSKPFNGELFLKDVDDILKARSHKKIIKPKAKVLIIENEGSMAAQLAMAFLKAGHMVDLASSVIEALERVTNNPNVVIVKFNLIEMPGDAKMSKLRKKLPGSKYILYTQGKIKSLTIAEKYGKKQGVDRFIELMEPQKLINAVEDLL